MIATKLYSIIFFLGIVCGNTDHGTESIISMGLDDDDLEIRKTQRNILQNQKGNGCSISLALINKYYNKKNKTWIINDDFIEEIDSNVQKIVDCASDGHIIMFDLQEDYVTPKYTINIALEDLTFTSYDKNLSISDTSVIPKTQRKTILKCPENKAAFNIISNRFTLANIEINDCNLMETDTSPVVFSNFCKEFKSKGKIKFHHVNFKNNKNYAKPACFYKKNLVCSSLEMIDMVFEDNMSKDVVLGTLLHSTIMRDIDITNNIAIDEGTAEFSALFLDISSGYKVTARNVNAFNNIDGSIFRIRNGSLEILDSVFQSNNMERNHTISSTSIDGLDSSVIIKNTKFSDTVPVFIYLKDSELEVEDTVFEYATNISTISINSSAIRIIQSNANIVRCNFIFNNGTDQGGAIYAYNSNMRIDKSTFLNNMAQKGGAIYSKCLAAVYCNLNIMNSKFMYNSVLMGDSYGGALSLEGKLNSKISDTKFYGNLAGGVGGGIRANKIAKRSSFNLLRVSFIENISEGNGGGLFFNGTESISKLFIDNCNFENNNSKNGNGGGMHLENITGSISNTNLTENYCQSFGGGLNTYNCILSLSNLYVYKNNAERGGGIYIGNQPTNCLELILNNSNFVQNNATWIGGAADLAECNATITNTVFEKNEAGYEGGGIDFYTETLPKYLNIDNCSFIQNFSEQSCGGLKMLGYFTSYISNSYFFKNKAKVNGGAILAYSDVVTSNFTIKNTIFENNIADSQGQTMILMRYLDCTIKNSTIKNNRAKHQTEDGAAITVTYSSWQKMMFSEAENMIRYERLKEARQNANLLIEKTKDLLIPSTVINIEDSLFSNNIAENKGPSVINAADGTLINIKNTSFTDNYSKLNGNIYLSKSEFYCEKCTFNNNNCSEDNGGVINAETTYGLQRNRTITYLKDCSFLNNKSIENGGGSIYCKNSKIKAINSSFVFNLARSGGAIDSHDCDIDFSDVTFKNNKAESGGAIRFSGYKIGNFLNINGAQFEGNQASGALEYSNGGGALALYDNPNINLRSTIFLKNEAVGYASFYNGGAIFGKTSKYLGNITIDNCTFVSNTVSGNGGGIYVSGFFQIILINSLFSKNVVKSKKYSGGAFFANGYNRNADEMLNTLIVEPLSSVRAIIQKYYQVEGTSIDNGIPSIILEFKNVIFENNQVKKSSGGALQIEAGVISDFSNCSFTDNSADMAGAILVSDSEFYCSLCIFRGNTGNIGAGAIEISGKYSLNKTKVIVVLLKNCTFDSNHASEGEGGAIHISSVASALYILDNTCFMNNTAQSNGGAISAKDRGRIFCSNSYFIENNAGESGGAIYINIYKNDKFLYILDSCDFIQNKAEFGAALHMYEENTDKNECFKGENCTAMFLRNNTFTLNEAKKAGGAMMIKNPNIIVVDCDLNNHILFNFSSQGGFDLAQIDTKNLKTIKNQKCLNMFNNKIDRDGYGTDIATYPIRVHLELVNKNNLSDIKLKPKGKKGVYWLYRLEGLNSGSSLPKIYMKTVDYFNNGPAYSLKEVITAVLSSEDNLFIGSISYDMNSGYNTTKKIKLVGFPGEKEMKIEFFSNIIDNILIRIDLGKCNINQQLNNDGNSCEPCPNGMYNVYPSKQCIACPKNAFCGTDGLVAVEGYWHSTPCSEHIDKCITYDACIKSNLKRELFNASGVLKSCNFNETEIIHFQNIQCDMGYEGPVCGSCAPGYGRMTNFQCSRCAKKSVVLVLFIVSGLFFLALVSILIKENIMTIDKEEDNGSDENNNDPNASTGTSDSGNSVIMIDRQSKTKSLFVYDGNNNIISVNVNIIKIYKRTIIGMLKVFMNYLQVTATAIAINVYWYNWVKKFLSLIDYVASFSPAASFVSFDCLIDELQYNLRISVTRMILSILWPLCVLIIIMTYWIVITILKKFDFGFLRKRIILSVLVIAYFSYLNITKQLMLIFYCYDVHKETTLERNHITKRVWLEDTMVECNVGVHRNLSIILAWPLFILFTIGFPVMLICTLVYVRFKNLLTSKHIVETIGFLYKSYRDEVIFWDSVIFLRKALLAIIIVFAYPLGGNQQSILCILVLVISLCLHMVCMPFKQEFNILNQCESLSLIVSIFTFTAGLLFNDDMSRVEIKIFVQILVILANMMLILGFFGIIIRYSNIYLRVKYVLKDIISKDDNLYDALRKLIVYLYSKYKNKIISWFKKKPAS